MLLSSRSLSIESDIRETVVGLGYLPEKFPSEYAYLQSFNQTVLILASITACYYS